MYSKVKIFTDSANKFQYLISIDCGVQHSMGHFSIIKT